MLIPAPHLIPSDLSQTCVLRQPSSLLPSALIYSVAHAVVDPTSCPQEAVGVGPGPEPPAIDPTPGHVILPEHPWS